MNYYPFHIGDYVCATRHLSWEEDAAYRRLLDTYYTTEKPLPLDEKKIFRLVLASSKTQREAVLTVLEEFFSCTDDGWVNERAQKEIEEMRVKQSDIEKKNAHETERMRRYRERRAAMFEGLRPLGVVPAWDVSMTELQRLFDMHCNTNGNAPETHLKREQVVSGDAPATAIPTPTPTPTPIKNTEREAKDGKPSKRGTRLPTDWHPSDALKSWANAERPDLDMQKTIASFADYWRSKAGSGGVKLDWEAAFRNWVRKERSVSLLRATPAFGRAASSKHAGFSNMDYREGIAEDGTFA